MKAFATLMNTIESTNKSNSKLEALGRFFDEAEEADKLWLLALFTGKRPKRVIPVNLIKQWAIEKSNIPEWLFQECYAAVGDLSETIALILPEANETIDLSLAEWMEILHELKHRNEEQRK